jgi:hypothetical protein
MGFTDVAAQAHWQPGFVVPTRCNNAELQAAAELEVTPEEKYGVRRDKVCFVDYKEAQFEEVRGGVGWGPGVRVSECPRCAGVRVSWMCKCPSVQGVRVSEFMCAGTIPSGAALRARDGRGYARHE